MRIDCYTWGTRLVFFMVVCTFYGCTSTQKRAMKTGSIEYGTVEYGIQGGIAHELIWPIPPETPRIQYQGQIRSQYSLGYEHSFWSKIKQAVLGIAPTEVVSVYRPFDVYVDLSGNILVSDGSQPAITVFDPVSKTAKKIIPSGSAALAKPMGITGDAQGNIYVADPIQRRIVAIDIDGNFIQAYGGQDLLLNPIDVAVAPESGHVYVVDSYLHQLLIFDHDGNLLRKVGRDTGNLHAKNERRQSHVIGLDNSHRDGESSDLVENRSKSKGEFHYPAFVAVAPDGTVLVSDGMNFRIQAFDAHGDFKHAFGDHGDTPGAFARPKDLAVDSEGHVYVVDAAFNNIQIFDQSGQLLLTFAAVGSGPGDLYVPIGIDIDEQDKIYVADRYNNRLQIYQYLPEATEAVPRPQLLPASGRSQHH